MNPFEKRECEYLATIQFLRDLCSRYFAEIAELKKKLEKIKGK